MSYSHPRKPPARSTKPTISDLAERLNLSKGTVSLILNNKGGPFSEETRQRVFAAAREIGYRPDALARALATGKSGFVALWVKHLVTSYYAEVAHAMEEALEQRGYQIIISPFGRFEQNPDRYFGTPVGMDGIIAHEIDQAPLELLFATSARPVPVITTGIYSPPGSRDHVQVDIGPAVTEAIHHLASLGRSRIAYAGEHASYIGDVRGQTYSTILEQYGLKPEYIDVPRRRETIRAVFRDYVAAKGCPGAIFCHNDDTAIAIYRALCDLERRVPEDCALVGCDGLPDTEYRAIPISTIVQPFVEMSETACTFLEMRLAEPDLAPQWAVLPATLALRESSAPG